MSQRVNIQYSIKLEDLESEIKRLIDKGHLSLESLSEEGAPRGNEVLSLETLRTIARYRDSLAEIDHILRDAMNIVNGFIQFQTRETYNVEAEQLEQDVSPLASPTDEVGELENQLRLFRNAMETTNEVSP